MKKKFKFPGQFYRLLFYRFRLQRVTVLFFGSHFSVFKDASLFGCVTFLGGNRQGNSGSFANSSANNSTFSAFAAWETLPEFEPGKPWRGSQLLSADEDPHLTPGSVQNKNPLMNAVTSGSGGGGGAGSGGGHYNADSQWDEKSPDVFFPAGIVRRIRDHPPPTFSYQCVCFSSSSSSLKFNASSPPPCPPPSFALNQSVFFLFLLLMNSRSRLPLPRICLAWILFIARQLFGGAAPPKPHQSTNQPTNRVWSCQTKMYSKRLILLPAAVVAAPPAIFYPDDVIFIYTWKKKKKKTTPPPRKDSLHIMPSQKKTVWTGKAAVIFFSSSFLILQSPIDILVIFLGYFAFVGLDWDSVCFSRIYGFWCSFFFFLDYFQKF